MRRGFTLVELIVHLGVASLILMMVFSIIYATGVLYKKLRYRYAVEMRLLDTVDSLRVWGASAESMDWRYLSSEPSDDSVLITFYPSHPPYWIERVFMKMCMTANPNASYSTCKTEYESMKENILNDTARPLMFLLVRRVKLRRQKINRRYSFRPVEVTLSPRLNSVLDQFVLPSSVRELDAWLVSLFYLKDADACEILDDCGYELCKIPLKESDEEIPEDVFDDLREAYYRGDTCGAGNLRRLIILKEAIALDKRSVDKIAESAPREAQKIDVVSIDLKASVRVYPRYLWDWSFTDLSNPEFDKEISKNRFFFQFKVRRRERGVIKDELYSMDIPVSIFLVPGRSFKVKKMKREGGGDIAGKDTLNDISGVCNGATSVEDYCSEEIEAVIVGSED